jgi:hypothetical protein
MEEVRQRQASQKYGHNLSVHQRYVLREMKAFFSNTEDADLRGQINILDAAFKKPLTTAIKKQINVLRRNGVTGRQLLNTLADIYHEHGMKDYELNHNNRFEEELDNVPRLICSEALM